LKTHQIINFQKTKFGDFSFEVFSQHLNRIFGDIFLVEIGGKSFESFIEKIR